MNIFETVKMRALLNRRYKLKAELMRLENVDFYPFDQMLYKGGISAERWIRINCIREQITKINNQISELLRKEEA